MVRIGALFAALVLCSPAYAGDEFWVKAGASGNGKAKDTPAGTIIPLLQAARRGDVIHVAQGEYYGRDLKGEFAVDVPDLTLVGGYNDDFSERNPFKYPTVLKRKKGVRASYTEVLDGLVGTNPQAHAMGQKTGCSGFILDGFFLDATTRNVYAGPGPRLGQQGSWKAPLLKMITADFEQTRDIKIRNCVFVNNYYQGVLVKYWGEHNEVTNCLFVNCSIAGVDGSGAQAGKTAPTTKLHVKNSTFACFYSHDKATQAKGVNGGSQGKFLIENNVFAYLSGPQGPGVAAKGDNVTVRNNVFWFTNDIDKIIRDQKSAATGAGGRDDEEEEEEE
ncbi:MAG TPA: hypothetical protein DEA08_07545, partial [Planctomycetes bacterium]|nr:hypothetical protein [Planctomycetota bacterium]